MDARWRIEMLGGLRASCASQDVRRFRSRKVGALLAYLAFFAERSHPRDALVDLLWPDEDLDVARNRFRVALASLRRQIEPPGVPPGAVLVADHSFVRLNADLVTTDVAAFQAALQAAEAGDEVEHRQRLRQAVALYQGELLPGHYEEWVLRERQRLEEAYLGALGEMTALLEGSGDLRGALQWARRAVATDPLREESHRELIRLLAASGEQEAALRQAEELARLLEEQLGESPSRETRALLDSLRAGSRTAAPSSTAARARLTTPDASREALGTKSSPAGEKRLPEAPALSTGIEHPGSLPLRFSRFFGREEEIALLSKMLTSHEWRLITLMGPGGTGKTRLAIETAKRLGDAWPGAIWFVDLVDLQDAARLGEAIRDAMHLPRAPGIEPMDQVVAALASHPTLLVLDNFEQLAIDGAPILGTLLERVAGLTCLVTSRQRLSLPGEQEFPVAPLPTPANSYPLTVDSERQAKDVDGRSIRRPPSQLSTVNGQLLTAFPSVQLFVDRAQEVRPDFQVTAGNAAALAELCVRLEGIPLAIELAAARVAVLTPAQMLARLEKRFDLLARRRGAEERHLSLRAALDSSYQLLEPEFQRFFARLSVFRGSFSLEAAEDVCGGSAGAVDALTELRECSLVSATEIADTMRYRLLETLREYGAEQLTAEEATALAERHAAFFLRMAEAGNEKLGGAEQGEWLDRLELEHENLRAALTGTIASSAEIGLRLGAALWRFWEARGYLSEGRERLESLLQAPGAGQFAGARAAVLNGAGRLAFHQGDYPTARQRWEESLAIARDARDRPGTADLLNSLGIVAKEQGEYAEARSLYEESFAIRRELGDDRGMAVALGNLGVLCRASGDYTAARGYYEESLARLRVVGDRRAIARSLINVGNVRLFQGELVAARSLYEESLAIARDLGDRQGIALALDSVGLAAIRQADHEAARAAYEEALDIQRSLDDRSGIAYTLHSLGSVALRQGSPTAARSLYQESLTIQRDLGDRRAIAECLEGLAGAATALGEAPAAARLLGAAEALREAIGAPLPPVEEADRERIVAGLRENSSREAIAEAWAAGRDLTLELAVQEALTGFSGASTIKDPPH
jgi:predicted ATPase/DNA-binding SARP family transcriptional activator